MPADINKSDSIVEALSTQKGSGKDGAKTKNDVAQALGADSKDSSANNLTFDTAKRTLKKDIDGLEKTTDKTKEQSDKLEQMKAALTSIESAQTEFQNIESKKQDKSNKKYDKATEAPVPKEKPKKEFSSIMDALMYLVSGVTLHNIGKLNEYNKGFRSKAMDWVKERFANNTTETKTTSVDKKSEPAPNLAKGGDTAQVDPNAAATKASQTASSSLGTPAMQSNQAPSGQNNQSPSVDPEDLDTTKTL